MYMRIKLIFPTFWPTKEPLNFTLDQLVFVGLIEVWVWAVDLFVFTVDHTHGEQFPETTHRYGDSFSDWKTS